MTETLWVEPRLRGFVVLADARNPPSKVGSLIPYHERTGVPRSDDVVLKESSVSASITAKRAMERDFRRRVGAGLVHHEFERPWRGLRWMSTVLAGVVIALVVVAIGMYVAGARHPGTPLLFAFLLAVGVAMLYPASRINVRSLRLEGDHIEGELRTGDSIRRPVADIERVRIFPMVASLRLRDGPTLWAFWDKRAHRDVLFALRHPHQYSRAATERREMRAMGRRCLRLYFPLAAAPFAVVCAVTQAPMFGLPTSSPLIGPVAGAAMYAVLSAHVGFFWLQQRVNGLCARWIRRRDRRRRQKASDSEPPRSVKFA